MPAVIKMDQKTDPASDIYKKLNMKKDKGGVWRLPDGYEVAGNRVLLATFDRPEKTAGGVYLTDRNRDEEKNQGKACLIVGLGQSAFVSDQNYDFRGFRAEIGDWVCVHVWETRPILIEGHACRIAFDTTIQMKIPGPDRIY